MDSSAVINEQQKFMARVCTFHNKRCSPEKRQAIACKAMRLFLWHILPEGARKGIEGVELLLQGVPDNKAAKKAVREAPRFGAAHVATFKPFTLNNFITVFDFGVEALIQEAQDKGRLSTHRPEVEQFRQGVWARFNDLIEPFVDFSQEFKDKAPSKVRPDLKYFSPLFQHPQISADADREWVYFNLFEESERHMMFNAFDAWDAAAVASSVTLQELDPILQLAKHANLWPRGKGLGLLILLAQVHEAARQALLSLLDSKKALTRWQCITHIDYYRVKDLPREFIEQIIRKGLDDRVPRTRQAAADLMMRYQRKDLLSLLEKKLALQKDEKTIRSFQFVIPLVRDGYFLEEEPDGGLRLISWTPYSVGSGPVSKQDATPEKIKKMIAEKWAREEESMGDLFKAGD
jgi:hypothetical protein